MTFGQASLVLGFAGFALLVFSQFVQTPWNPYEGRIYGVRRSIVLVASHRLVRLRRALASPKLRREDDTLALEHKENVQDG